MWLMYTTELHRRDAQMRMSGLELRRQTFDLSECTIKEDKMATLRAIRNNEPTTNPSAARVDMKLEVVVIPVSDVDRAKEFYARLGWRLDADFTAGDDWRGVQFTRPAPGAL